MTTQLSEIALLEAARQIAVAAECLERVGVKHVRKISTNGARNARNDVAESIDRLQRLHDLLTKRMSASA
jgi:hypothetical protein